jgi:hypothetical protein
MPSIVELSELCDAAYYDRSPVRFRHRQPEVVPQNPFPFATTRFPAPVCRATVVEETVSWNRPRSWQNRLGFFAASYERPGGGVVLAFRGTDDLWDGLLDDTSIAMGGVPPQVLAACAVARSAGLGSQAYLTGHSLGGALALIVAAREGLPAVTFNAPGVMDSCIQSADLSGGVRGFFNMVARCVANNRVRNIRMDWDPVSSVFTTGLQAGGGRQTYSAAQCGLDALCRHGIRTCVEAVRKDASNFRPLDL